MNQTIVDLVLCLLIAGMTYALMSEGLWGSALMFFNVLFSGIIAFNFYEPLAGLLAKNVGFISGLADMICLMTIFCVSLVLFRLTTETLAPSMVRYPTPLFHLGRIVFGLAGALVTMTIILLAYETAPVHKKVFTTMDYTTKAPFGLGLDRQWLGFFQYTTGLVFTSNSPSRTDPYGTFKNANVFDPKSEWLISHQDARPYGTDFVLSAEAAGAEGGSGEAASGGAAASGGGGRRPGDPAIVGPAVGGGVVVPTN